MISVKFNPALPIIAVFIITGLNGLRAQHALLAASGNAGGGGGTVSYSVGQVAFSIHANGNAAIMEGIQQPYEILFMEGIGPEMGITLECLVYPNPATTTVNLKIESHDILNPGYQIYNMNGLLLRNHELKNGETCIPMDDLLPATYNLAIIGNGIILQTYKVIKK